MSSFKATHLHTRCQIFVDRAFHLQAFSISPSRLSFQTLFLFPSCSDYKIRTPADVNMELRVIVQGKQSCDSKADLAGWGAQPRRLAFDWWWRIRLQHWHSVTSLVLKTVLGQFLNVMGESLLFMEKNQLLPSCETATRLLQWEGCGQW